MRPRRGGSDDEEGGDADRREGGPHRQARPRGRAPRHPVDRHGGVFAQRPVGRPHRRDRGAHAHVQAHDLLLFRRQGGALPACAGGGLRQGARGRERPGARSPRSHGGARSALPLHLRPPPAQPGLHPDGHDREHPPRSAHAAVEDDPRREPPGNRGAAVGSAARSGGRRLPEGVDPLELHWQISALSFFNVSNAATFSFIFGESLFTPEAQETLSRHVAEMVLRYVLRPEHVGAIGTDGR